MFKAQQINSARADASKIVSSAAIVVDTNVLFMAYRLSTADAEEYLRLLSGFQSQFRVPHRVAFEYERRRQSVIDEQVKQVDDVVRQVEVVLKRMPKQLHKQHPYFTRTMAQGLLQTLITQLHDGVEGHRESAYKSSTGVTTPAQATERITADLNRIFGGAVESGYEFDADLVDECRRRAAAGVPPGGADASKGEPDCYGDAYIWLEILEIARGLATSRTPLIFVTGDFKHDWWFREGGQRVSARFELIQELSSTGLTDFAMLSPRELFAASGATIGTQLKTALKQVEN